MSLGLTLAKAFEGAALGTLGAAKERDKRVKEETDKRDILFQKALAYAEKDKDKYNAAKESARKRFDLATAELSTMIGDPNERRVVAANMAKQFSDTGSLQKALDNYSANIKQDDTPFEGLDFANVNMEAFKHMSDTDVAAALVSPSLLPKGVDSYYKPSAFKDESILFGGLGQPQSLKAQQEQYASLAEASGLNITASAGEIPLVSLSAPSVPYRDIGFDKRLFEAVSKLKRAEKGKDKEAIARATEEYNIAYKDLEEYKRRTSTKTGGQASLKYTSQFISTELRKAGNEPAFTYRLDPTMSKFFTIIKDTKSGDDPEIKLMSQREAAYRFYIKGLSGNQDDTLIATKGVTDYLDPTTISNAVRIRGRSRKSFTKMIEGIKSEGKIIAKNSDAYNNLLPSQKGLVDAYYSSEDRKAAANVFSERLADILVQGYFVPENFLIMPKSQDATPQFKSLVKDILLQK